jgi:hypothetical protein
MAAGDDADATEVADAAASEPTELAGVAQADTAAAYAWAEDDGPELDLGRQRLTPSLITAIAVTASLVIIAAAGVVVFLHQRDSSPEPAVAAAPTITSTTVAPVAAPPPPPPVTVTTVVVQQPPPPTPSNRVADMKSESPFIEKFYRDLDDAGYGYLAPAWRVMDTAWAACNIWAGPGGTWYKAVDAVSARGYSSAEAYRIMESAVHNLCTD